MTDTTLTYCAPHGYQTKKDKEENGDTLFVTSVPIHLPGLRGVPPSALPTQTAPDEEPNEPENCQDDEDNADSSGGYYLRAV